MGPNDGIRRIAPASSPRDRSILGSRHLIRRHIGPAVHIGTARRQVLVPKHKVVDTNAFGTPIGLIATSLDNQPKFVPHAQMLGSR